jgi:hypothetical protein
LVTSVALSRLHRGVGGRGTALRERQKVCATYPPPFTAEPGSDRWGPR